MPRLLDLFCGAGGAAMGYYLAGFTVVGVDIEPQPNYPFEFHQADATTYPLEGFDVRTGSPPCDDFTPVKTRGALRGNAWMLQHTIERFRAAGGPYVVENVPMAHAEMPGAYRFCGRAFGLHPLKRHRLFLTDVSMLVPPCACSRRQVHRGRVRRAHPQGQGHELRRGPEGWNPGQRRHRACAARLPVDGRW